MANDYSLKLQVLLNTKGIKGQLKQISEKEKLLLKVDGKSIKTVSRTLQDSMGNVYKSVEKVNVATGKTTAQLTSMGKATKSVGADFLSTFGKVAKFGAITAMLGLFTTAVYKAGDAIKETDKAITEFRKVSSIKGEELKEYTKQLGELGNMTARTTAQMIDASTQFKKSGYTEEQSANLSQVATLFQNIADSELSAGDSASFIISQIKAFNIETDEAINVIDKVNEVSNNFPVSSTDISSALTKTSGAMVTYGNTIDETIGLTVAGSEILTNQAGKVARGLRSTGAEIVKLANETGSFSYQVGGATKQLSLFNEQGEMLSTFDVLSKIYKDWKNMSSAEKSNLALKLGMKTQIDVLSATLNNFDSALRATETSLNSNGSAMEENEAYMESLEARTTLFKKQFEDLVLKTINTDAVKGFINLGTAMLQFANSDIGQVILKLVELRLALLLVVKAGQLLMKTSLISSIFGSAKGATSVIGFIKSFVTKINPLVAGIMAIATAIGVISYVSKSGERELKRYSETLGATSKQLDEIKVETDKLEGLNRPLNDAEKERLEYLKSQTKELGEQQKLTRNKIANTTLDQYSDTKEVGKTRYRKGEKITYNVEVKVTGQEGIELTKNKIAELSEQYKNGTITQSEYINKTQELISGMDGVFNAYQEVINSGGTLTEEQWKVYESILRVNKGFIETGGSSNIYSEALDSVSKNTKVAKCIVDVFTESLKLEGDQYYFTSVAAKNKAKTQIEAELQATKEVIRLTKQRIEASRLEEEALVGSNKLPKLGESPDEFFLGKQKRKVANYNKILSSINSMKVYASTPSAPSAPSAKAPSSTRTPGSSKGKTTKDKDKYSQDQLKKFKNQLDKYADAELEDYQKRKQSAWKYYDAIQKKAWKYYKAKKITYDEYKQYVEGATKEIFNEIDHRYDKGIYSASEYFRLLEKYAKNFYKKGKISYDDYRSQIEKGEKAVFELRKKNLEKQKDKADAMFSALDFYAEEQQNSIDKQIDALNEQLDLIDKQNEAKERQLELTKLQQDLEDARREKIRIFQGGQWRYVSDPRKVKEAEDALSSFYNEESSNAEKKAIEDKIASYEKQKQAWSDLVDNFSKKQNRLEIEMALGESIESAIFGKREQNIENFKNSYTKAMEEIINVTQQLNAIESQEQSASDWNEKVVKRISEQKKKVYTSIDSSGKIHWSTKSQSKANTLAGKTKGYASGTTSNPVGGFYNLNERGNEISIPPDLNYLPKKTGIIPHTMAENLMEIGRHTWSELKNANSSSSSIDDHSISIQNLEVKTNNANDFVRQLQNLAIVK